MNKPGFFPTLLSPTPDSLEEDTAWIYSRRMVLLQYNVKLPLKIFLFAGSKHPSSPWYKRTQKIICLINSLIYFYGTKLSISDIHIWPIYLFLQGKEEASPWIAHLTRKHNQFSKEPPMYLLPQWASVHFGPMPS